MAAACTDVEFMELFKQLGSPQQVARTLGVDIRNVYTRRRAIEQRYNVELSAWNASQHSVREAADNESGIYVIQHKESGRSYVGQAVNIKKRWIVHLHHLNANTHHSQPLQNGWNKYGADAFEFSVLERVERQPEILTAREQYWMDELKSHVDKGGYNISPSADSNLGVKYSDESRERMSKAQKGRTFTDEAKAKISASLTGRTQSQETKDKRNNSLRGKERSPEQIKSIREAHRERVGTPEYEAFGKKQTLRDWAEEYGINKATLRNRIERGGMDLEEALTTDTFKGRRRDLDSEPLSETLIPKIHDATAQECIDDLRNLAIANPEVAMSRNWYRVNGKYAESAWSQWYGTFEEFKRQAGIKLSRQQHQHERHIAKHASVDHYRRMNIDRQDWDSKYLRENNKRFKTILTCSDLHDIEIDPFYLRVLVDTARRVQPDVISLVGDIFDLPEFGKYGVDPREWDVVARIRFAHDNILGPLRDACPDAQIDFIEGNHEARLLRQLADATPALRAVLSDLHGFTVSRLFGLDQFEINYVAKADLASFTKRDFTKELATNYKIYWDTVLCHHFPHARNMGLPGVNGHHHKHIVWSEFNPVYGAYEWHQLGAGHKRSASYCEGERWHNGFALINVDTQTRSTVFDYISVTDFAVSGGKWYARAPSELDASVPARII